MDNRKALVQCRLCRPSCMSFDVCCPTCGCWHTRQVTVQQPTFPFRTPFTCHQCGTQITAELLGFGLNPTGERPAAEVLSDVLPALERAWATAAPAPSASQPHRIRRAGLPPSPSKEQRGTLHQWAHACSRPDFNHLAMPARVAAGYRRVFGVEPPRRPRRSGSSSQPRVYSLKELAAVLVDLGDPSLAIELSDHYDGVLAKGGQLPPDPLAHWLHAYGSSATSDS